jgi:hypothetical protein
VFGGKKRNVTFFNFKESYFSFRLNVLDAIHWVNRSWTETKETTIVTWFRDAGFPLQCPTEIHSEEESDPDDDIPLAQLIRVVRQGAKNVMSQ